MGGWKLDDKITVHDTMGEAFIMTNEWTWTVGLDEHSLENDEWHPCKNCMIPVHNFFYVHNISLKWLCFKGDK